MRIKKFFLEDIVPECLEILPLEVYRLLRFSDRKFSFRVKSHNTFNEPRSLSDDGSEQVWCSGKN